MPRKARKPSRNKTKKSQKVKKTKGVAGRYKSPTREGTRKSLRISAARNRKDMDNLFKGFESIGLKPKNNSPKKRQGASKKKSRKAGANRMEGVKRNGRNNKSRVSRKPSISTIQELFRDLKL
jgi:hypothetical protein